MSLATNEGQEVSEAGKALGPLFRSLMAGLHAAAQPLTVLRVRLDEESIQTMPEERLRRTAIDAIAPVDRLCALVSTMQLLVTAEYLQPLRTDVDVASLLRGTIEGLDLVFAEKGIDLVAEIPSLACVMSVDGKRFEEAMVTSLLLMESASRPGDRIEIRAWIDPTGLRCILSNRGRSLEKLTADQQLSLALAEVDFRTQGGSLTVTHAPLQMDIALPASPKDVDFRSNHG